MTNSSPQDPQNSIPERRKRLAGGVTVDEMIGIIVAFSTIGTILFWSLGSKRSGLIDSLGLGRVSNLLSTESERIEPGTNFTGITDADSSELTSRLSASESVRTSTSRTQDFDLTSAVKQKSYQLDSEAKLVPLAGVATLPSLTTKPDGNQGDGTTDNVNTGTTAKTEPQTTVADQTEMPNDVTPSYWAYPFVKQMSDEALVPEFTDDRDFAPDNLISRAGMAKLISQAFDMQPETQGAKKFKDVTNEQAIAADIDKAVSTGFMQGYSDDEFRPWENISRYQVLVALATGLGLKPSQDTDRILQKFADGKDIPDWAKQQVAAAAEARLIVNPPGYAKNTLMPNQPATRAEVAAMIHQALVKTGKLKPIESEYILNP